MLKIRSLNLRLQKQIMLRTLRARTLFYYNSDNLTDYVKNVNIIRTRFPEHIKRILKNVQKILID